METARDLFEFARDKSKETFDRDGSHMPMFIVDGEQRVVVGAPWQNWEEKQATVLALQEIAKKVGATRVAMILESWMVQAKEGEVDRSLPPSKHPDRVEVIWILVRSNVPGEADRGGYWKIRRQGRPRAVDFVDLPGDQQQGIFDAILPRGVLQ